MAARQARGQRRARAAIVREVPFEQTLAAVFPPTISADDIRSYVNVNLARLERFVEREIYFREAQESIAADSVSKEEVIDETIAAALATGRRSRSAWRSSPGSTGWHCELWTNFRAPTRAMATPVPLEDSARQRNVKGSDEPGLQFHQPDESITGATVIADVARSHAGADYGVGRTSAPDRVRTCATSARVRARPSFCMPSRASASTKLRRLPVIRPIA